MKPYLPIRLERNSLFTLLPHFKNERQTLRGKTTYLKVHTWRYISEGTYLTVAKPHCVAPKASRLYFPCSRPAAPINNRGSVLLSHLPHTNSEAETWTGSRREHACSRELNSKRPMPSQASLAGPVCGADGPGEAKFLVDVGESCGWCIWGQKLTVEGGWL